MAGVLGTEQKIAGIEIVGYLGPEFYEDIDEALPEAGRILSVTGGTNFTSKSEFRDRVAAAIGPFFELAGQDSWTCDGKSLAPGRTQFLSQWHRETKPFAATSNRLTTQVLCAEAEDGSLSARHRDVIARFRYPHYDSPVYDYLIDDVPGLHVLSWLPFFVYQVDGDVVHRGAINPTDEPIDRMLLLNIQPNPA